MKTFNRYIIALLVVASGAWSSCNKWLDLKPEDGLVAQDFWETKEHIRSAVNGIYISLITDGLWDNRQLTELLFMHGEIRANLIEVSPAFLSQEHIDYRYANLLETNRFSDWSPFYRIINYCNHVIDNAPGVKEVDPTLSQEELDAYVGEALTIRAWMYFYLARIWGDVPLKMTFTESDDDELYIEKSPQEAVFNAVIADLERAKGMVKETFGETAGVDKGKVTVYTVHAMLADAYLWVNAYDKALEACDQIIDSEKFELVLGTPSSWLNVLFANGNSVEGIFELQYDRQQLNPFHALLRQNPIYLAKTDIYETLYGIDLLDTENFDVRGDRGAMDLSTGQIYKYQGLNRDVRKAAEESNTHWMVYRYADVLLMKAEALNGLTRGAEALELIYEVRERANALELNDIAPNPNDHESITTFLLEERAREFAYEGKRWFDVLRNARRNNYARMDLIDGMVLAYAPVDRQQAMLGKYRDPNSHYMPIHFTELQVNKLLEQNPFYNH